jgi:hypoxanthine phosphoribosyltransferase
MQQVSIGDKDFEVFLNKNDIDAATDRIAKTLNADLSGQNPIFAVILNGAFMFAADLLKKVNTDCEVTFLKYSSYSGTKSTGEVKELLGFSEEICGRTVVIVEDIIDTGLTVQRILKEIGGFKPYSVKIATLLYKPDAFKEDFKIDYIGFEIPNDFVVGYGLDYNGFGRNLQEIYKLKQND